MRFFYFFVFISVALSGQYNFKKLDQRMRKFVDDGELVGIQTKVIKNNKVIHYNNYGLADFGNQKPLMDNSIFRIASITCLLYTSPSPRDRQKSRMPSSA